MFNSGCIVCGADLAYRKESFDAVCVVCAKTFSAQAQCEKGHYVCDACHGADARDYMEIYCGATRETDPQRILVTVMKNPKVNMHGPEHHFLVPAALLASYCNVQNKQGELKALLSIAKDRAKIVPGGFCGYYGSCGAGVGTGIFISVITGATPLSKEEWRLCNLMTSKSLENIANAGGPRCCKRNSFLAIKTATEFLKENFGVTLPTSPAVCEFSPMNKDCKGKDCIYQKTDPLYTLGKGEFIENNSGITLPSDLPPDMILDP